MSLETRLISAMEAGLGRAVEEIFAFSQRDVPVDKGTLKKSGGIRKIPNGWEIFYRTPYAPTVEFGFDAHEQRVRRHYVMDHQRRRFRGKRLRPRRYISVRAHYRGPFTRHMPARAGQYFLAGAVEQVRPRFGRHVGRALAREFAKRAS